ncbi:MAG: 30S ribosomal protein S13 [bacterium]|nr:30S ribosomal protein S13 [bacterium]
MPRISGINIPDDKRIEYSLTYVYGIGLQASRVILKTANVAPSKKAKELIAEEVNKIQAIIDSTYKVEGDLRREVSGNVKRLKEIGAWRGTRHARRLPIHGRTKTNSRTIRGNVRKTMGSGRKPAGQKT